MDKTTKIMQFLASAGPYANTTATNTEADEIMMKTGGTIMGRGILYNIVCKSVSPGVCHLSLEDFYKAMCNG